MPKNSIKLPDIQAEEEVKQADNESVGGIVKVASKELLSSKSTYLKHCGEPQEITITEQRFTNFRGEAEDGKFHSYKVVVGMHRSDNRDPDPEHFELKLANNQKVVILYEDGEVLDKKVYPVEMPLTITDYPHIVKFPVGKDKWDAKKYTILCGETVKVENPLHADLLFKRFGFLDKVDEDGKVVHRNRYRDDKKEAEYLKDHRETDLNKIPKAFEEIEIKAKSPRVVHVDEKGLPTKKIGIQPTNVEKDFEL